MNIDKMILDSIIDMLLNCKIRHNYIIFIENYNREKIAKYLKSQIEINENIIMKYTRTVFVILNLKTGATLRIMKANTNSRGFRSFLSLYDDFCSKETIDTIIRPMCLNLISFNVDHALIEVEI